MSILKLSVREDSIYWLEWEAKNSSENLLTLPFIEELSSVLQKIESSPLKALVMLSKKERSFCAGADINEIQKISSPEEMKMTLEKIHSLFHRLEKWNGSKIVAIRGSCLGGGLELALCFDYRLTADSPVTKLALPETRLGLIPGAGANLRLPRLIGLGPALNMILSGKSLSSKQAKAVGLSDENVPSLVLEKRALELAREVVRGKRPSRSQNFYKNRKAFSFFMSVLFKNIFCFLAKRRVFKKTSGFYPAPLKALEVIRKTYNWHTLSQKKLQVETEAFCRLFQTPTAKNLMYAYSISQKAKKKAFIDPNEEEITKRTVISRVGVVGAGVMGRSIAFLLANKGFKTRLVDNNREKLCSALNYAEKLWDRQTKISPYELQAKRDNLSVSDGFSGFPTLDLVIEALPENLQLKQKLIGDISKHLNRQCLLASNTSSLNLEKLSQHSAHPENFLGFHFFNPAHEMPLVEIALKKEQKHIAQPLQKFVRKIAKFPLLVKDSPGFVVNRLLAVYLTEALWLFEEGNNIPLIDKTFKKFGLPLGPFQLMDKIGLDICTGSIYSLSQSGIHFPVPQWMAELVPILGLGEKSGEGFYMHNKKIVLNQKTKNLKRSFAGKVLSKQMIERGIFRMINEGKKLMKEDVLSSEEDLDLALILGMGFPPFLGGPMKYAESLGLPQVRKTLKEFSQRWGPRFEPCF